MTHEETLKRRALYQNAQARAGIQERFAAEITFARKLSELEGDAATGWDALITRAEAVFARATGASDADMTASLHEAEGILAPIGAAGKEHTVICAGHGHIDMNWQWGWPETVSVTNDTFLTVLKLMDEFPDFTFNQSQAAVYDIARQFHPELFDRIKARVKEGRWEITASHWVEGDKNIASGESLTRHLLTTRQFFQEHFGLSPEDVPIDWEPDTFGHAVTIPTADAGGGVRYYYHCRGGDGNTPPVFWWEAPDGSRLLVSKEIRWYNSEIDPLSSLAVLEFREKTGLKTWLQAYGVGDHGGGPTRRDIRRAIDMNTWPIFPNFRFGTTREFFDLLNGNGDRWPVVTDELNYEFAGCYSSQSSIKKANRTAENALEAAEIGAVLAHVVTGRAYPAADLKQAWTDTLFSHFHDILPGSGVTDTRTFCLGTLQRIIATTTMVATQSLRAVTAEIDTSFAASDPLDTVAETEPTGFGAGAGYGTGTRSVTLLNPISEGPRPFVVFNPTGWDRTEVVTATLWDTAALPEGPAERDYVVTSPDGTSIPAQKVSSGNYWGHKFVEVAFPASTPALGYSTYALEEGEVKDYPAGASITVDVEGRDRVNRPSGQFVLENEFLRVGFDRESAGIVEFLDKKTGVDLADPAHPMAVLEYGVERPQNGSAWILANLRKPYEPLEVESFGADAPGVWNQDIKQGPHVVSCVAVVRINQSKFTVTYKLAAGEPRLDVTITGQWLEVGGPELGTPRLVFRVPTSLSKTSGLYEAPFGSTRRESMNGREVPAIRWADVSGVTEHGHEAGITVLNDGKSSHALKDGTLRVTLIRSTYNPDPLPELAEHTMRFALVPHGETSTADMIRWGAGFNHPLTLVAADVHRGKLPSSAPGIHSSAANVLVTHVKKAEEGDGLVLRLLETDGKSTKAAIEIGSLLGAWTTAETVDFLERPTGTSLSVKDGAVTVDVPHNAVVSLLLR